jgi:hypothetical protein
MAKKLDQAFEQIQVALEALKKEVSRLHKNHDDPYRAGYEIGIEQGVKRERKREREKVKGAAAAGGK